MWLNGLDSPPIIFIYAVHLVRVHPVATTSLHPDYEGLKYVDHLALAEGLIDAITR